MNDLALVGITIIFAFYLGLGASRLRMPSLIGYMLLGVLLGGSFLGLITRENLADLQFLTNVALGFMALSIGVELSAESLKRQGWGIIIVIVCESLATFFVVTVGLFVVTRDGPMSMIFGAMAAASAPAGTVAVIQEYRAKGSLTKAMFAVVGFDDAMAIVIFGFAMSLASSMLANDASDQALSILPGLVEASGEIGLSLLVGAVIGFLLSLLLPFIKERRNFFILVVGAILLASGLSTQWHLSLILTNMVVGFVLVNRVRPSVVHEVSTQMMNVMPLLFILFFALGGAQLEIGALRALGLIGVVYTVARTAGKLGGCWLGAVIGKADDSVRKYLGMGILAQAGVAIGLALIVNDEMAAIGTERATKIGAVVLTTITATSILFGVISPPLTKYGLDKSGEIPKGGEPRPRTRPARKGKTAK